MGLFVFLVVIVSTLWVLIDAMSLGVRRGALPGSPLDMGPLGWALCTLLLWILGFPMYLVTRPKYVALKAQAGMPYQAVQQIPAQPTEADKIARLQSLANMRATGALSESEFERLKAEVLRQ